MRGEVADCTVIERMGHVTRVRVLQIVTLPPRPGYSGGDPVPAAHAEGPRSDPGEACAADCGRATLEGAAGNVDGVGRVMAGAHHPSAVEEATTRAPMQNLPRAVGKPDIIVMRSLLARTRYDNFCCRSQTSLTTKIP